MTNITTRNNYETTEIDGQESSLPDDVVIRVRNIGKCYQIYDKPKDRLKQALWRGRRQYFREFWALRDVSFDVKRGETLGIIGRNGSGKSTLLQMICGTLTPSEGTVETRGRVAALLELGSGFNPEFTGIENIYLSASLHGLSNAGIEKNLDKILAFADIGEFVNQPVKTYSSGMQLRLAFSVIAHIDADILVIDEALSVGDIFFTQKCMRFIKQFAENKSLLFVSHDTSAVTSICNKSMMLRNGSVSIAGNPRDVLLIYLKDLYTEMTGIESGTENSVDDLKSDHGVGNLAPSHLSAAPKTTLASSKDFRQDKINNSNLASHSFFPEVVFDTSDSYGSGEADLLDVDLIVGGKSSRLLSAGEIITLLIRARCLREIDSPIFAFTTRNARGQDLFADNTCISHPPGSIRVTSGGECECRFTFAWPHLPDGEYTVEVAIAEGVQLDWRCLQLSPKAISFQSEGSKCFGLVGIPMQSIEVITA